MAKTRNRPSMKYDREIIALAAISATVEDAAVKVNTSVRGIKGKALKLGISIKNGRLTKRSSAKPAELGLKVNR